MNLCYVNFMKMFVYKYEKFIFLVNLFFVYLASNLKGYIQSLRIFPNFHMYLFSQVQLECIKALKPSKRMLYLDATSSLVSLNSKQINKYFDVDF